MICICEVEGCDKRPVARGFCRTHYMRWRRQRTPLTAPMVDAKQQRQAKIDFVLSAAAATHDECIIWPWSRDKDGYPKFTAPGGVTARAHRYVCRLVHGPAPESSPIAAHSCGNGHLGCISGRHLRWKDAQGNSDDCVAHGKLSMGEAHSSAKLTEAQVKTILSLLHAGVPRASIARMFCVTPSNIGHIKMGRKWKHLPRQAT